MQAWMRLIQRAKEAGMNTEMHDPNMFDVKKLMVNDGPIGGKIKKLPPPPDLKTLTR
jgi:hypothetical protein